MTERAHVVVVGGGIGGLSAALSLQDAREQLPGLRITLLEAGPRVGGLLATRYEPGLLLEEGPDSFIRTKPDVLKLCDRLGVETMPTEPSGRSCVAWGDATHPIPDGFHLFAPGSLDCLDRTELFSAEGKARMAKERHIPRRASADDPNDDESLASFVRRRLGRENLERLAQPLVAGVYSGDPERLSLRATMPRILDMEAKHGSMIAAAEAMGGGGKPKEAVRYSMFRTPRRGMAALVQALVAALDVDLRPNSPAIRIARSQTGWTIETAGGSLSCDAVIIATPTPTASELLRAEDDQLADQLAAIRCSPSATLSLVYEKQDIPAGALVGFGLLIPAACGRATMAFSYSSQKWAERADPGRVVLRAFLGGALGGEGYALDDDALPRAVRRDLKELLGITAAPSLTHLARIESGFPHYDVGHLERVSAIEAQVETLPGLALAGNSYRGVGVSDAVRTGQAAAARIVGSLGC